MTPQRGQSRWQLVVYRGCHVSSRPGRSRIRSWTQWRGAGTGSQNFQRDAIQGKCVKESCGEMRAYGEISVSATNVLQWSLKRAVSGGLRRGPAFVQTRSALAFEPNTDRRHRAAKVVQDYGRRRTTAVQASGFFEHTMMRSDAALRRIAQPAAGKLVPHSVAAVCTGSGLELDHPSDSICKHQPSTSGAAPRRCCPR
jgi:hypothetical protein